MIMTIIDKIHHNTIIIILLQCTSIPLVNGKYYYYYGRWAHINLCNILKANKSGLTVCVWKRRIRFFRGTNRSICHELRSVARPPYGRCAPRV